MRDTAHTVIPNTQEPLYEHYLAGGVYPPDDEQDYRTDFYLKESTDNLGKTVVADLHVVNGSSDYCCVQTSASALRRLATFFVEVAERLDEATIRLQENS